MAASCLLLILVPGGRPRHAGRSSNCRPACRERDGDAGVTGTALRPDRAGGSHWGPVDLVAAALVLARFCAPRLRLLLRDAPSARGSTCGCLHPAARPAHALRDPHGLFAGVCPSSIEQVDAASAQANADLSQRIPIRTYVAVTSRVQISFPDASRDMFSLRVCSSRQTRTPSSVSTLCIIRADGFSSD